jgi:hypothetical protein
MRGIPHHRVLTALCVGALVASCVPKSVDTGVFKCATSADCGAGLKCVEGLCAAIGLVRNSAGRSEPGDR